MYLNQFITLTGAIRPKLQQELCLMSGTLSLLSPEALKWSLWYYLALVLQFGMYMKCWRQNVSVTAELTHTESSVFMCVCECKIFSAAALVCSRNTSANKTFFLGHQTFWQEFDLITDHWTLDWTHLSVFQICVFKEITSKNDKSNDNNGSLCSKGEKRKHPEPKPTVHTCPLLGVLSLGSRVVIFGWRDGRP